MPIGPYVVDFACWSAKLVVELDGSQHAEQIEKDQDRTEFLESQGYCVLRFWNNEVIENLEGVLETLTLALSQQERELASHFSRKEVATKSPSPEGSQLPTNFILEALRV